MKTYPDSYLTNLDGTPTGFRVLRPSICNDLTDDEVFVEIRAYSKDRGDVHRTAVCSILKTNTWLHEFSLDTLK